MATTGRHGTRPRVIGIHHDASDRIGCRQLVQSVHTYDLLDHIGLNLQVGPERGWQHVDHVVARIGHRNLQRGQDAQDLGALKRHPQDGAQARQAADNRGGRWRRRLHIDHARRHRRIGQLGHQNRGATTGPLGGGAINRPLKTVRSVR